MIRIAFIIMASFLTSLPGLAENNDYKPLKKVFQYRLYLHDKHGTPYDLKRPLAFLSAKSIERRHRQGLAIDSTDLPVSPIYVEQIRQRDLRIMGTSRWHNTVTVESATDDVIEKVKGLAFIDRALRLYVSPDSIKEPVRDSVEDKLSPDSLAHGFYGDGYGQIKMLNGIALHEAGFRGRGMTIAILDAGFHNADHIPSMRNINIIAAKDFAPRRSDDIFKEHYHGTMVLSTMAMNRPDTMVGTAPDADYVLIRTEDIPTETRAEEDSWTMGAEYADSIGADIINSSLGYNHWDGDTATIQLRYLDGRTTFVSQTASMLARKGIILCNSAGNEGSSAWHKIGVPADADGILSVGAVGSDSIIAPFSSLGPSQDGRVKPDVCSPGVLDYVVNGSGELTRSNGTSFASPIMCGMVACLWQAFPNLTAYQIMELVRKGADRHSFPDNVYGYGIPDFKKIYQVQRGK